MIIATEVSSQARYDQRYQSPLWPGGRSGVTIGIGYDVGYATADWVKEDWAGIIPDADLAQLQKACKVTGTLAEALTKSLASIRVPWDAAYKQFASTALRRWTAETIGNIPNAEKLPPDCLGALVSIDYNRGPAWKLLDDRHKEMRAIRLHMVNEEYALIPTEIRSMARLWANEPGMAGLVIRRNLEAALFEKGLKST
jgi:GH24 family phage-related lysozyme (muramidase)